MAIIKQQVDVPFTSGLDEKTDDKLTASILSCTNIRQAKTGAVSQRYGSNCIGYYDAYMASALPITTPELLTTRSGDLVRAGHSQVGAFSQQPSTSYVFTGFRSSSVVFQAATAVSSSANIIQAVTARAVGAVNSYIVVAYTEQKTDAAGNITYAIYVSVYNVDTMTAIVSRYEAQAPSSEYCAPRVATSAAGNVAVVWVIGTVLYGTVFNSSTAYFNFGGSNTIATVTYGSRCDIATAVTDAYIIVYEDSDGLKAARLDEGGIPVTSAVTVSEHAGITLLHIAVSVTAATPLAYIVWAAPVGSDYTSWEARRVASSLAAGSGAGTTSVFNGSTTSPIASLGVTTNPAGDAFIVYSFGTLRHHTKWLKVTSVGVHTSAPGEGLGMAIKIAGPMCVPSVSSSSDDYKYYTIVSGLYTDSRDSVYLVSMEVESAGYHTHSVSAVALPSVGYALGGTAGGIVYISDGRYAAAIVARNAAGDKFISVLDIRVSNTRPTSAQIDNKVFFSGGVPSCYDGASVFDVGFAAGPPYEYCSVASVAGFGGLTIGGVYRYLFTYEWVAADGSIVRSQTSNQAAPLMTTATNDTIRVSVPNLSLSNKQVPGTDRRPVTIGVYRTTANAATYYVSQERVTNVNSNSSAVTSAMVVYDDITSDADLRTRAPLYTTGGILPDEQPPSASCVAVIGRRVWYGGTFDDSIWFSAKVLPGEIARFSSSRTIDPFEGGPVQAIGYLGEQEAIIFKRDATYAIRGDGPTIDGLSGAFTEPERVSSEVGCVDPRSVVSTTAGLFFLSRSGICLLGRDFKVQYIGKAVEDTLGSSTITSAVLVPDLNEVRFTIDASKNVLVYDLIHNTWRLNTYPSAGNIVSATYWSGKWTFIDVNGRIWQDTYTSWVDTANGVSSYVNASLWTSAIKVSGVQGWQRTWDAYLLLDRHTSHGLSVSVYTDYNQTTPDQTKAWTSAEVDAWTSYQPRVHMKTQKAQSVSLLVQSTPTSGTLGNGRGFTLQSILLEVGVTGRASRNIPSGRTG